MNILLSTLITTWVCYKCVGDIKFLSNIVNGSQYRRVLKELGGVTSTIFNAIIVVNILMLTIVIILQIISVLNSSCTGDFLPEGSTKKKQKKPFREAFGHV